MMYVELMKNFLVADSSELLAVRLISASLAQKRLIPTFWTRCTSSSWKIFFSPIRASWWQKTFLDMIYVELMKNFRLADSSELLAVRLISASWAQKRFIPTF